MKRNVSIFLLMILLSACNEGQKLESKNGFAVIPEPKEGYAVATYAGGCFWAMQECLIELKGVDKVISGYAGGSAVNPTYEEVLGKKTGHAESVQVYYRPNVISFEQLTQAFFHAHDPTQIDRQGPDIGTDYRSIAFYRTEGERKIIRKLMDAIDASGIYPDPLATEISPFKVIYPAEMEHQNYYKKNSWDPYIRRVSRPKVLKLRKAMPAFIKSQYVD
ncbi:peptide-methionine (S)-S-oxide reductase MsrA [Pedobacter metabolipauper]|uniref:Peptide methionine sulfoxide reductase MsrA n=1 Tax=Pedobacter metabolipauper TaxID=425513 RepID=A0A4V3D108_9SPHI|nr:peptide-methionine (S)-S-oxide reductase MsrA [Pedobacter metabolipauper]TDQ08534.1 peptide-methionine (S)-S-oxide reductase [Pedobacter metabolipauper]